VAGGIRRLATMSGSDPVHPAPNEPPRLPDSAVCLHCGYLLRGLPGTICPECGHAFDPTNPLTWRDSAQGFDWRERVFHYGQPLATRELFWVATFTLLLIGQPWDLLLVKQELELHRLLRWLVVALLTTFYVFRLVCRLQRQRFQSAGFGEEPLGVQLLCMSASVALLLLLIWHYFWLELVGIVSTATGPAPFLALMGAAMLLRRPLVRLFGLGSFVDQRRREALRWFGIAVCLAALVWLWPNPLSTPEFLASRPFLVRKAGQMRAASGSDERSQRIGLLTCTRVAVLADGRVKFEISPGRAILYDPDRVWPRPANAMAVREPWSVVKW
jgi:hypothetical protein